MALDRKDLEEFDNLLEENPTLNTPEAQKIRSAILGGVEKNELKSKLTNIFNEIGYKARNFISKNIKEIIQKGDLKAMLKFIGDEAFKEYEKEQIKLKESQALKDNEAEQE